jgi:hypothetical protein
MEQIFEANTHNAKGFHKEDFTTEAEARSFVEANGSGHVTTFVRGFDGRERSCALNKFEAGVWVGCNIH